MYLQAQLMGWVIGWETVEEMEAINQMVETLRSRYPSGQNQTPKDADRLRAWANHILELDSNTISGHGTGTARYNEIMKPHRDQTQSVQMSDCDNPSLHPANGKIEAIGQDQGMVDTCQQDRQTELGRSSGGAISSANAKLTDGVTKSEEIQNE